VFAHELAHVALGHFPLWVVSQLAIAIHFYQPLVHWLGRQLRFQQELAADELAITAFGSRRGYADVLARLALAHCRPAASRATLGLFMSEPLITRRIAMLRTTCHASHRRRLLSTSCAFAALLTAALLVAGFRATPTAHAAEELGATSGAPFKTIDDQAIAVTALLQVSSEGNPAAAISREDWKINIRTQATILGSRIVLDTALKRPEIAKLPLIAAQSNPTDWVAERLTVAQIPDSEILHVQMKGAAADREAMRQIVDAIVKAYLDEVNATGAVHRDAARMALVRRLTAMKDEIQRQQDLQGNHFDGERKPTPETQLLYRELADATKAKAELEQKLAEVQSAFMVAEQQWKERAAAGDFAGATGPSLEAVKLEIAKLGVSLSAMSAEEARDGERVRKQVQDQLQQLLDQLNSRERRIREGTSGPMQMLRKEMQIRAGVLQQQIGNLDKTLQEKRLRLDSATQLAVQRDEREAALKRQRDVAADLQSQLQQLEASSGASPRVRVIQWAM
jgi:hypothetical protein